MCGMIDVRLVLNLSYVFLPFPLSSFIPPTLLTPLPRPSLLPSLLFPLSFSLPSPPSLPGTDTKELSPHSQTSVVGPASVASVKDGQDLKYDNEFVIAEVNADLKYYYETKGGKFEFAGSNMTLVSFS